MARHLVLLLAVAAVGAAGLDARAQKDHPVMKVVRLLQDIRSQLQKELEDDKAVYEQLHCWCKANDQEKSAAIAQGTQQVEQLKASLSEDAAKLAELKVKRKETQEELYADNKALGTATELRMKENKAFHAEEVDLVEAVKACSQAVTVLSKHNPSLSQVRSVARALQAAKVQELLLGSGSAVGKVRSQILNEFFRGTSSPNPSFLGVPGFESYSSQSGQIFGILKQMQADFEEDLKAAQAAEAKAVEEFETVRAAKQDEIASGEKQIVEFDSEIAALGEKTAQELKQLENTEAQLALDKEFLQNLRTKCSQTDEEFHQRTKDRLTEISAVEDTIKILNSDENFDLFSNSTGAASFLQISSTEGEAARRARSSAIAVLSRAARRSGAAELGLLVAHMRIDEFTEVVAEIDKLIAQLGQQQKDEVTHRDWCIKELNENNRSTEADYDKQESLQTKIADLEQELKSLAAKLEETKAASAEMEKQQKRASEVREAENKEFQQTVQDQRLTQMVLQKALDRMKQVYAFLDLGEEPKPGAPHIQTSGNHTDPGNGPARFTEYAKNAGGSRVVAMISSIIADSRKTEDEAIRSEQDAQAAYETFFKDANKSLKQNAETIVSLTQAHATATESLSMAKTDLKGTLQDLEDLNNVAKGLHASCDFTLKNFDARQAARTAEMNALGEAKAILKGAQ